MLKIKQNGTTMHSYSRRLPHAIAMLYINVVSRVHRLCRFRKKSSFFSLNIKVNNWHILRIKKEFVLLAFDRMIHKIASNSSWNWIRWICYRLRKYFKSKTQKSVHIKWALFQIDLSAIFCFCCDVLDNFFYLLKKIEIY